MKILIATTLLMLTSCASKTTAEPAPTASPAPTAQSTQENMIKITGKIAFVNPTFDPNTGIQEVQLLKDKKVIAQTKSTEEGRFEITGSFSKGQYLLKVNSKTLVGSIPVRVQSNKVENVVLPAKLTSNAE